MLFLLKVAHDVMDDYNAQNNPDVMIATCYWCGAEGYNANGLLHTSDCHLVEIRRFLDVQRS